MALRAAAALALSVFALGACSSSSHASRQTPTTARHTTVTLSATDRAANALCDAFQRKHLPRDQVDAAIEPNATSPETVCDIVDGATLCPYKAKDGVSVSLGTIHEFFLRKDGSVERAISPFRECPPKPR